MSAPFQVRAKDYASTPAEFDLRGILGAALAADWRQAFIARGYGWHADSVATFATPITGGGNGTVMDLDQPEFGISVPSGYTMVPLRIAVEVNPAVLAADNEITEAAILLDRTAAWAADGTVVSETPRNMRTDKTDTCPLSVFSAATADITDPVLSAILAAKTGRGNFGDATGMSVEALSLVYEPAHPLFVVGPGAVYCYAGGTVAATAYITATFLAFPSSLVTGLS